MKESFSRLRYQSFRGMNTYHVALHDLLYQQFSLGIRDLAEPKHGGYDTA